MEEQVDDVGRAVVMVVEEKPDDDWDEEEDDQMEVEEEMIAKVMRWLAREISGATATMPAAARGKSGGSEAAESCGPTFLDSTSTVMASVDTHGLAEVAPYFWLPTYSAQGDGGAAAAREEPIEAAAATIEEEEWLSRVLVELDDSSLLLC